MAIILAESFEDWASATGEGFGTLNGNPANTAGAGRRSGRGFAFNNTSANAFIPLPTTYTELFAAFAFAPTAGAGGGIYGVHSGTTHQISIRIATDGSLEARRGTDAGTLLGATAPGVIPLSGFTHYQIRVVISDTVGVVQVRLNGSATPILNLTGIDTNATTPASISQVRLSAAGAGSGCIGNYDDLVVWDTTGSVANTWLGDVRVDSYFPNGNGDSSQFVGSDGNSTDNYLLVDATAPNGTDYVQSDVVGNKDLYQFQNLSHTPSNIYGVIATASALKDDAGNRDARLLAKTGTTEVEGTTTTLSTSRTRIRHLFETDPTTGVAWTKSGVDGAQFGMKVQA